jgi:RimJ/RimL family protein N-acetyltransferase
MDMSIRDAAASRSATEGVGPPGQPLGAEVGPDEPPLPRKLRLAGRHVQLSPVAVRHYDLIYEWASREEIPWQWRGRPVSPEGLRDTMWADCLFHYVVETRVSPRPVGLVTAYGANFHHGTCYLQAGLIAPFQQRGWPLEAVALALGVVFHRYNMRRVYAQATADHFAQFASGEGVWFDVEGRLRDSVYMDGRYVDSVILTVTRERWEARVRPLVERWQAAVPPAGVDDGRKAT